MSIAAKVIGLLNGIYGLTQSPIALISSRPLSVPASGILLAGVSSNSILASLAASADRTITFPNASGTVGLLESNQTWSGIQTLTTPVLGVASVTSINKVAVTAPATGATLTIADGKTLTVSNNATVSGTNTGDVANTALTTGTLGQFATTTSAQLAGVISDETGTGVLVFSASPALTGVPTAPTASPGDSTTQIATTAFVTTGIANAVTGVLNFKGSTDCSGNPNYPVASKGYAYVVSTAGKIGGASGVSVDVGDVYFATADNAGGTQASVGTSWDVLEHNLVGALLTANNLSDLTNAGTARTNLGLGTLATQSGTFSGTSSGTNTGDQTITLTGGVTGSGSSSFAATVITNANLTGPIASTGNATSITAQTGTGTTFVMSAAPAIAGGSHTALTGLGIRSTGAAFDLTIASTEVFTTGRTLTIALGDAARTLTLAGDVTLTATPAVLTANTFTAAQTVKVTDSATNTVVNCLTLSHDSNGVIAASYGTGLLFQGQDSTTADVSMGGVQAVWATATHASRSSQLLLQTVSNAGSLTSGLVVGSAIASATSYLQIGGFSSTAGAVWAGSVSPTITNHALVASSTITQLNAATTLNLQIGGTSLFTLNSSSLSVTQPVTTTVTDSATATVTNCLTLSHDSSGTAAASFGTGLLFNAQDSTTADQNVAAIQAVWTTATHASAASQLSLQTRTAGGSLANILSIVGTAATYASTGWSCNISGNTLLWGAGSGTFMMNAAAGGCSVGTFHYGFGSAIASAIDASFTRVSTGVVRVANGSTGAGSFVIGTSATTYTQFSSTNGTISTYNSVATAGLGVAPIYGVDSRTGLTAADGGATTLYTSTAANQLYRVSADIFATAAVTGTANYTITWTENSTTQTATVSATAINVLGTTTQLIRPDNGTNITAQLLGTFTGTFTVAGVVERVA